MAFGEFKTNGLDLDDACAVLDRATQPLQRVAVADPKLRHQVYDAFRLTVEDRPQRGLDTTEGACLERLHAGD